ncbi:hypothetical protein VTN31DRAFT_5009 [Thermomyces dupontii]|uniref:uncharacterized protein n=1 Tax=Talaromyces thermophilus TaxID=28565 RepID=UPI003741E9C5
MNTIRSTWIGWGALCVAGGGAYYFAKKSINEDRAARYEAEMRRKSQMAAMEAEDRRKAAAVASSGRDVTGSPSSEASQDPAPTRHEPETEREKELEKSKYEASEPFRRPRGNRFS